MDDKKNWLIWSKSIIVCKEELYSIAQYIFHKNCAWHLLMNKTFTDIRETLFPEEIIY
jgi:hypothetical protein